MDKTQYLRTVSEKEDIVPKMGVDLLEIFIITSVYAR